MSNRRSTGKKRKSTAWNRSARGDSGSVLLALVCVGVLLIGTLVTSLADAADVGKTRDGLRLSEVMPSGQVSALGADWIEIENCSDQAIGLAGYALVTESRPSKALAFSSGRLAPGERLLVYCDGSEKSSADDDYHAPFKLATAGETVALLNRNGLVADAVVIPALSRGQVYCRDATTGEWAVSDVATPNEPNRVKINDSDGGAKRGNEVVPGAVEITEAMSRNTTFYRDGNGDCPDYIEVHNRTDAPVNLRGWTLTDTETKPRKWEFPAVTLPPDGYLAVHCSGKNGTDALGHLHANFKLDSDGEELWLTDPDGATTGYVKLPALPADAAWSLTEMGWDSASAPSPGYANDPTGADAAADEILQMNTVGVYITEILASSNQSADWIELYNAGSQAADLSGFGLSDNAGRPRKWQFPEGTVIQPGAYLGVYADGNTGATDGKLHAGFLLSAEGGYSVTLSDSRGRIFDRLFVPRQQQNISFGRPETLRGTRYFASPTPGTVNAGETYIGRAPQPVYSVRGGLYHSGDVLSVELSVPSGYRVYYTLDYTDPTEASSLYTGPITVTDTTILRTRVYGEGCMASVMDTQSYLYDVKNGGGTVFVSSLVSDPYNLTSDEAGIMAMGPHPTSEYPYGSMNRGANFWMDWEREAHIEVFRPDGSPMISQECGIKLHGKFSRAKDQKPFKVIARGEYGSNRFRAKIFSRRDYTEYQSFVLRTGSQDAERTHMRDEVLQQMAAGTPLMYQEYELGVLYLNGQYWGHYNLRERVNTASICQWEGWEGDEDALDLVRGNATVMQGSDTTMQDLLDWLKKHDPSSDEAYDAIDSVVDIDSFIEYYAIQMYTGNTDTLNVKRYRNPLKDGKWRWVLFDLDCGFDVDTNSVSRWLDPEGMGRNKNTDNRLVVAAMKNPRIRGRFLEYLGKQMATTYSPEHMLGIIEDYYKAAEPITAEHLERWGRKESTYKREVQHLINYTKKRPKRMLYFLKTSTNLHLTREEMERYFGDVLQQTGLTYDTIPKD